MRLIFNPIVVVLFTLLILMFSFSMRGSDQSIGQTTDYMSRLDQDKKELQNQISELEKRIELANHPIATERIIRDQLWQKQAGEENLELQGFNYVPRSFTIQEKPPLTPLEEWGRVIFE